MSRKILTILSLVLLLFLVFWGTALSVYRVALEPEERLSTARIVEKVPSQALLEPEHTADSARALISVLIESGDAVDWKSRNPAAYRAKKVGVEPDVLNASLDRIEVGDVLRFDLFDGEQVEAVVRETKLWGRDAGTLAVTARFADNPHSYVALASTGGQIRAWIYDDAHHRDFQVRYDSERGSHVLLEIDSPGSEVYGCANEDHAHELEAVATDLEVDALAESIIAAPVSEEVTILDVLVVYTDGALAVEGSQTAMDLNISISFSKANIVHQNSETDIQFNVIHSVEVDHNESSNATNDLYALSRFDGQFDHIHYLREYYLADFVSFFVDTDSAGGLGFRPSSYDRVDYGYNLVRVQQSDTNSYTTVHELGHNMGSGHSKGQTRQPFRSGITSYAAGWHWEDSSSPATDGYCSVMTYENFNSSGPDEYDRVPHFSNSEVIYNGNATGHIEDGNVAKVFRDGRAFYAGFLAPQSYPVQSSLPYSLDFESGEDTSLWQQFRSDSQDWTLGYSGSTPSSSTGPSGAFSGSRYAYVEASDHPLDSALLFADFDLQNTVAPRIRFYYHMYDGGRENMGNLYFEASTDGGLTWDRLFARSGNQEDAWKLAEVDLSAYQGQTVRLHFRADIGNGSRSDIAIDQIVIEDPLAGELPATFAEWLALNHAGISDTSLDGDPDKDGVSSFVEYALGRSPDLAESGGLPTTEYDGAGQKLIFRFIRAQEAVRYQVEMVTLLGDWSNPVIAWDSDTGPLGLVDVGQVQPVLIDVSGTQCFVRLSVSE